MASIQRSDVFARNGRSGVSLGLFSLAFSLAPKWFALAVVNRHPPRATLWHVPKARDRTFSGIAPRCSNSVNLVDDARYQEWDEQITCPVR